MKRGGIYSGSKVGNLFDSRDNYAKQIPAFTIEGEEVLGTSMGMLGSYIQYAVIIAYFGLKMSHLVTGHELIVTQSNDLDSFEPDEVFDFKDNDFKLAFGVIDL
jgi:hypothetical protein